MTGATPSGTKASARPSARPSSTPVRNTCPGSPAASSPSACSSRGTWSASPTRPRTASSNAKRPPTRSSSSGPCRASQTAVRARAVRLRRLHAPGRRGVGHSRAQRCPVNPPRREGVAAAIGHARIGRTKERGHHPYERCRSPDSGPNRGIALLLSKECQSLLPRRYRGRAGSALVVLDLAGWPS